MTVHNGPDSHDDTQPWLPTVGQTVMMTHSHDSPQWARQPRWHTAMTTHSGPDSHDDTQPWLPTVGQTVMMTHSHDYQQWARQSWWHTAMTVHNGPDSHDDTQPWLPTMGQPAMMTHSHDSPQWARQPRWHTAMTTHSGPDSHDDTQPWLPTVGQTVMMTHSHDYPQWASQPWWHTAMTVHNWPNSHDDTQPWLSTMGQTAMMTHSHDYPQWARQPWHTAMTVHNGPAMMTHSHDYPQWARQPWWHTAMTTHSGPDSHDGTQLSHNHNTTQLLWAYHHDITQPVKRIKSTEVKETTNSTHRKQLGIRCWRVWSSSGCDVGTFLKTTSRDMFLSGLPNKPWQQTVGQCSERTFGLSHSYNLSLSFAHLCKKRHMETVLHTAAASVIHCWQVTAGRWINDTHNTAEALFWDHPENQVTDLLKAVGGGGGEGRGEGWWWWVDA